ncbi:MAG: copper transporter [Actinobacteria bacterium]|nr:copper transporter [Actinomycetota bacterium]
MLDMRYHVISLVAVLLALGIGILLGTTLVERGLIAEQKSEIESLKETFSEIKEKNQSLHDDLDVYRGYATESKPYMLANRLPERPFVVITGLEPDQEALHSIHDAIGSAGGNVPLTIKLPPATVYEDPALLESLASGFGLPAEAEVLKERVLAEVVEQLKTASNTGVLMMLDQLGVIQLQGVLPGPVTGAVLLGSIEKADALENTDLPLLRAFAAAGFPVVGVSGAKESDAAMIEYKKNGISTVDHVDTVPGEVALVLVLEGRSGYYGSGRAAERILPEAAGI